MKKERVIDIAIELGWGVRDLNDNDSGYVVKGARFQVYNPFMPDTGQTFWTEEDAWDFIAGRLQGGVTPDMDDVESTVTGNRGKWLKEMMAFRHPSLDKVNPKNIKGNVYALSQRKQGGSPSFFTMSVGIEVALSKPISGIYMTDMKTFHANCEGFDPVSQEKAMEEIYNKFQAWQIEYIDIEGR